MKTKNISILALAAILSLTNAVCASSNKQEVYEKLSKLKHFEVEVSTAPRFDQHDLEMILNMYLGLSASDIYAARAYLDKDDLQDLIDTKKDCLLGLNVAEVAADLNASRPGHFNCPSKIKRMAHIMVDLDLATEVQIPLIDELLLLASQISWQDIQSTEAYLGEEEYEDLVGLKTFQEQNPQGRQTLIEMLELSILEKKLAS